MDGKIFKISGYLVDPNGENEAVWIWEELRHLNDTFGQHVHVKEADILDWTDKNPLNYENCDLAECEKYFHDKYPVRENRSVEVGKTYRHFKGKIVEVIAIS